MVNDEFRHLLQRPVDPWAKAKKAVFWTAYCIVAFVVSLLVLGSGVGFPGLFVTVIAFIFGPKLWRSIR